MNHRTLVIDFRMHNAAGIGTYIQNIIPFLLNEFEVSLLGKQDGIKKYPWSPHVNIIECHSNIYTVKEQWELFKKVPACDIFWSPHYNIPLLPIRAKKRIVTIHDVFHLAFYKNLSFRQKIYAKIVIAQAIKRSDLVFTVSEFSKNEIKKYTKTKKNIEVIYNAVNLELFRVINNVSFLKKIKNKYQLPDNFILFVGNVKPHKNLKSIILAIKNTGINLVIVGQKEGFITGDPHLFELINNFHLKDKVFFTGYVENDELPVLYNLATTFVFPSIYEGFGIPPLEAQACGCPVVCSNKASLPEICGKDNVVYCDPLNVEELKKKIAQVWQNNKIQDDLKKRGLENIKRFSWKKSSQIIIKKIKN